MAFHRAIAPRLRHGRLHRRLVTSDPFGKPAQFRVQACLAAGQPIAQGPLRPLADQLGELIGQFQRGGQLVASGADRIEPCLLGRLPLLGPTYPLERQLLGRWWRGNRRRRPRSSVPLFFPAAAEPLGDVPPYTAVRSFGNPARSTADAVPRRSSSPRPAERRSIPGGHRPATGAADPGPSRGTIPAGGSAARSSATSPVPGRSAAPSDPAGAAGERLRIARCASGASSAGPAVAPIPQPVRSAAGGRRFNGWEPSGLDVPCAGFARRHRRRRFGGWRGRRRLGRHRTTRRLRRRLGRFEGLADDGGLALEQPLDRLAQILQQVPTIGDLLRLRRRLRPTPGHRSPSGPG